jgi:5-oxoprolinase (ATP-hydrolysing) subunit B
MKTSKCDSLTMAKTTELIYQVKMTQTTAQLSITALGDSAFLLDAASGCFDDGVQARIWAAARALLAVPAVLETVPGMNNLMVVFDPLAEEADEIERQIKALWQQAKPDYAPGTITDVPVVYGGKAGEDLQSLATDKGMTVEALVALHGGAIYTVAAVGAMPGFVYLSGLDPLLSTPRRSSPRQDVAKGSVIIGGSQAGIMPVTAPSGWHILGKTDMVLFDAQAGKPATFSAGDRIRFVARDILP